MKFAEVAENVKRLVDNPSAQDEFIFELLLAYGTPKATIARLKSGQANLAKEPGEVLLKKIWFKKVGRDRRARRREVGRDRRARRREVGRDRRARRDGQLGDLSLPNDLFEAIEAMKTAKAVKTMASSTIPKKFPPDSAKRITSSTSPSTASTAPAPSPPTKNVSSTCLSCMRR